MCTLEFTFQRTHIPTCVYNYATLRTYWRMSGGNAIGRYIGGNVEG